MDIFWIKDGKKQGPLPEVEIISCIQRGDLANDTKGWHSGCQYWVPLKELPALAPYMNPKPSAPAPSPEKQEDISLFEEKEECDSEEEAAKAIKIIIVPSPALRFWARFVDMMLVLVIGLAPISLFKLPYDELYLLFVWLLLIPYETLFIHFFGTTPGKALLNIKVLAREECPPCWKKSFLRSLYVYVAGLGFMAPILVLIMPLFSWFFIHKNKIAVWDMTLDLVCFVSSHVSFWRVLLAVLASLILAQFVGMELMPWNDDMMQSVPPSWREVLDHNAPK